MIMNIKQKFKSIFVTIKHEKRHNLCLAHSNWTVNG